MTQRKRIKFGTKKEWRTYLNKEGRTLYIDKYSDSYMRMDLESGNIYMWGGAYIGVAFGQRVVREFNPDGYWVDLPFWEMPGEFKRPILSVVEGKYFDILDPKVAFVDRYSDNNNYNPWGVNIDECGKEFRPLKIDEDIEIIEFQGDKYIVVKYD